MEVHVGKTYEHVKSGNHYIVIAVGKDSSEDLTEVVVYEAQYDNPESKVWVRPKADFLATVTAPDGTKHPRFRLVEQ